MRRAFLFPLGIGFALVAVGLLLLNGSLVAAAIPVLLIAAVRLLSPTRGVATDLIIERSLSTTRAVEGDEIDVDIAVDAVGPGIPLLAISDTLPGSLERAEGEPQFLGRLRSGEAASIHYTVIARRGLHRFGEIAIRTWSPWSLAVREESIRLDAPVKVHPRIEKIDPITIRPRRTRAFAGPVRANRGGQGLDFFGCRAYSPGDDIRRINWRAYARQDSLVVNEYELERIADVNIILDARAKSHMELDGETTFDHSVRAAAALASHFLDQGNNVGLLIYGSYVHWIFPGIGRLQQERILDELSEAQLGDKAVFEELRFIPTRLFPPRSQLVLVSPLADEEDIEIAALLVERGYSMLLVCPHSLQAFVADEPSADEDRAVDLATRILGLRRDLFLGSLAAVGTSVVDWRVEESLREACQQIHHSRVRRYRL
jgi:uncharacterized protein (DUF58 family)